VFGGITGITPKHGLRAPKSQTSTRIDRSLISMSTLRSHTSI